MNCNIISNILKLSAIYTLYMTHIRVYDFHHMVEADKEFVEGLYKIIDKAKSPREMDLALNKVLAAVAKIQPKNTAEYRKKLKEKLH